jgi:hypothetical protein
LKIKAFNIKDPDGNFLQFVERLSWPWVQPQISLCVNL